MSFSSESLSEYEAVQGGGQFARVIEDLDHQQNPASTLVLRNLARAAELGDQADERISEIVARVASAVFSQESPIAAHSISHEQGVDIGGKTLPFLPSWRLHVDLHTPNNKWPVTSLDPVRRVDFMLYPQTEDENDTVNDVFCNLAPSVVFTRNIWNRWAHDTLNSTLELKTQAEVLGFITGLDEGLTAPQ